MKKRRGEKQTARVLNPSEKAPDLSVKVRERAGRPMLAKRPCRGIGNNTVFDVIGHPEKKKDRAPKQAD